jgi:histidyl-tRNA synthetase
MPAAGFALSLERVMIALAAQGVSIPVRALDAVVGGRPADVARVSAELRDRGWRVVATTETDPAALAQRAKANGACCWIVAGEAAATLVEGGTLALAPVPAPPTLTRGGLK